MHVKKFIRLNFTKINKPGKQYKPPEGVNNIIM